MNLLRGIPSLLVSPAWWKDALGRALATAIAIALPYLAGAQLGAVPWATVALAAGMGAVASMVTSLAGLPEAQGQHIPLWLSLLERCAKTFGQALASGFVGAVLLTDVSWGLVLQAAALSTLVTLLRWVLTVLGNPDATVHVLEAVPIEGEIVYRSPEPDMGPSIKDRADMLGHGPDVTG